MARIFRVHSLFLHTGSTMNNDEYKKQALVTVSNNFHGKLVYRSVFANRLRAAIDALNALDEVKKCLFYGREMDITNIGETQSTVEGLDVALSRYTAIKNKNDVQLLIHGIIGKATECGELLEVLVKADNLEDIDIVNIIEELGDDRWYDQLIFESLDVTAEHVQQVNINKLRKRFPDGFKEYDANNRNLEVERETLEKGNV